MATRTVFGFSLLGPQVADTFQVNTIGYFLAPPSTNYVDLGAPKNLGEGYRWNTPNIYYTYDANFADYFGSNGMAAVDAAFAVFNNLSNVDSYSTALSEWPQTSMRENYTAAELSLLDLKSFTMQMICEQLGLAQPQRWIYCLHDRFLPGGASCPNYEYLVIQRNYDPLSQVYSQYVNGTLYGFSIEELCGLSPNPYAPLEADAVEYPADPAAYAYGYTFAAADYLLTPGYYYTSLTRDDIGGLRYLYSTNRIDTETVESNSVLVFTNTSNPVLLVTSNLAVFLQQALTNTPTNLIALYPGLIIPTFTNYFSNVVTTNITAYFTNLTYGQAGTLYEVFATNYTTNVELIYVDTFANVVTNHYYSNGYVTISVTNIGPQQYGDAGTMVTNVQSTTVYEPFPNGDFYIIPSNSLCSSSGYQILYTQFVNVVQVTNILGTNNITVIGGTNSGVTNGEIVPIAEITYFTNYYLAAYPIQCLTNGPELLEGIEKVNFIRQDYDSLISGIWTPVTNNYTLTQVTNSAPLVQTYQRTLAQPDILITASDLASGPASTPANSAVTRNINFNSSQALVGLAGPGTIGPGVTFTYNKVGPIYYGFSPGFLTDGTVILDFLWATFDGTTNQPVVYPNTVSISNLVNEVFFQITNSVLANASITTNNVRNPYGQQLGATGGTPPYTWSLATNSPAVPPGLNFSAAGLISGEPTTTGIYDFTIQATDSGARVTQRNFSIQVFP